MTEISNLLESMNTASSTFTGTDDTSARSEQRKELLTVISNSVDSVDQDNLADMLQSIAGLTEITSEVSSESEGLALKSAEDLMDGIFTNNLNL